MKKETMLIIHWNLASFKYLTVYQLNSQGKCLVVNISLDFNKVEVITANDKWL